MCIRDSIWLLRERNCDCLPSDGDRFNPHDLPPTKPSAHSFLQQPSGRTNKRRLLTGRREGSTTSFNKCQSVQKASKKHNIQQHSTSANKYRQAPSRHLQAPIINTSYQKLPFGSGDDPPLNKHVIKRAHNHQQASNRLHWPQQASTSSNKRCTNINKL